MIGTGHCEIAISKLLTRYLIERIIFHAPNSAMRKHQEGKKNFYRCLSVVGRGVLWNHCSAGFSRWVLPLGPTLPTPNIVDSSRRRRTLISRLAPNNRIVLRDDRFFDFPCAINSLSATSIGNLFTAVRPTETTLAPPMRRQTNGACTTPDEVVEKPLHGVACEEQLSYP